MAKYGISEKDEKRILNDYAYHAPTPEQVERYQVLCDAAEAYARAIYLNCPDSRERSVALTELDKCVSAAKEAIIRNEK